MAGDARFLAISDVHLLPGDTACDQIGCETSHDFWTATQTQARALIDSEMPDFVIYLGDLPAHGMSEPAARAQVLKDALDGLQGIVHHTDIPLFYLPGNNDTLGYNTWHHYQYDYCPFTEQDQSPFTEASNPGAWPVINGAADIIDDTHLADGYYAARIDMGAAGTPLRILALNTVIYTTAYTHCTDTAATAGSTQLDWVTGQLDAAAAAGEAVYIAMHVPPGIDGFSGNPNWSADLFYAGEDTGFSGRPMQDVLLDRIARHAGVIRGVIAGHTHLNGIRRLHACDADRTVSELLVSVPGVSTDHHNNPAVKVFHLDSALEPVDVTTYTATSGEDTGAGYSWDNIESFSFRTNYPNQTPPGATLHDQVESMSASDRWQGMWDYLYARYDVNGNPRNFRRALDTYCSQ